ncbi:MAG: hypothetical protein Q7J31_11385 [Syntrophales bacterium]|nr:hypothetical protein [Syntrophales bacterium]
MENIGELSGTLTRQSTVTDPAENRLDILRREYVRKVGDWPSVQITGQMKQQNWFGPLSIVGKSDWYYERAQTFPYKDLMAWVDSWEDVENLISRIRLSQNMLHAERTSNRLRNLRDTIREEDGNDEDISAESIHSFFLFLKMHPNIRYPDITLTPDGNVYSRWKGDNGSLFSVEFLPDSRVGYVVFAPSLRHGNELSRNSGIDFVDTLFDRVNAAFGISAWVLE